jgi:hypothetical protein
MASSQEIFSNAGINLQRCAYELSLYFSNINDQFGVPRSLILMITNPSAERIRKRKKFNERRLNHERNSETKKIISLL